jgi:hypothetical protein
VRLSAWLLAAGLAVATAASAQTGTPVVPPPVTNVATGGEWHSANATGILRVVIADEGFAHVHSRLWIEWLIVRERGAPRLAARVLVKELSNGLAVLAVGERRTAFQGGQIRLQATNPYSLESRDVTIEAGKPGQYKIL